MITDCTDGASTLLQTIIIMVVAHMSIIACSLLTSAQVRRTGRLCCPAVTRLVRDDEASGGHGSSDEEPPRFAVAHGDIVVDGYGTPFHLRARKLSRASGPGGTSHSTPSLRPVTLSDVELFHHPHFPAHDTIIELPSF